MSWTLYPAREFARHVDDWTRLHASLDPRHASALLAAEFVAPLIETFGRGDELLATNATIVRGRPVARAAGEVAG